MYTKVLVKDLIEDGRNLLSALRDDGFPVSAAFWVKLPESDRLRLVIASPLAEGGGQIAAYRRLQGVLGRIPLSQLKLFDISVFGSNDSDYKDLVAKNRNIAFEDSYVYEL